jgi:hypothetical protein
MKLELSRQIFERKAQISSFIKIRLVGVELFHADGHDEDVVAFRSFWNAPKNCLLFKLRFEHQQIYFIFLSLSLKTR